MYLYIYACMFVRVYECIVTVVYNRLCFKLYFLDANVRHILSLTHANTKRKLVNVTGPKLTTNGLQTEAKASTSNETVMIHCISNDPLIGHQF